MNHAMLSQVPPPPPGRWVGERRQAAVLPLEAFRAAEGRLPAKLLQGCRGAVQRIAIPGRPSIGVTSALRGEGRSSVALGMALVEWLDYERRTVLVDLDFESQSLHRRLGLEQGTHIDDLVGSHADIEQHLQQVTGDLYLLSISGLAEEAPRMLGRLAQSSILSQLSEWADAVVFDLPPVLGTAAGLEAVRLCGTPVMVVRAGITPVARVKEATAALAEPPPVVLNGVETRLLGWLRRAAGH
jgi:tyrosine-protein kinase Etk/Wzc